MSFEEIKRCASCGIPLTMSGSTVFECPFCGEGKIGRCSQCRDQGVSYKCSSCGFEGP